MRKYHNGCRTTGSIDKEEQQGSVGSRDAASIQWKTCRHRRWLWATPKRKIWIREIKNASVTHRALLIKSVSLLTITAGDPREKSPFILNVIGAWYADGTCPSNHIRRPSWKLTLYHYTALHFYNKPIGAFIILLTYALLFNTNHVLCSYITKEIQITFLRELFKKKEQNLIIAINIYYEEN